MFDFLPLEHTATIWPGCGRRPARRLGAAYYSVCAARQRRCRPPPRLQALAWTGPRGRRCEKSSSSDTAPNRHRTFLADAAALLRLVFPARGALNVHEDVLALQCP